MMPGCGSGYADDWHERTLEWLLAQGKVPHVDFDPDNIDSHWEDYLRDEEESGYNVDPREEARLW